MGNTLEDFELGDRVRVITETLDHGTLLHEEGSVKQVDGWFEWPLLVKLDNDDLNGLFGGVFCSLDEVENLGEGEGESETGKIQRLKEELKHEKEKCASMTAFADEWETIANEWRERYENLKSALAVLGK